MKRTLAITVIMLLIFVLAFSGTAIAASKSDKSAANTITEGEVYYSSTHYLAGEAIPTGYDVFGYNYQAHMFKGYYVNAYFGGAGYPPYEGDTEAYLAINPAAESHWAWEYRDVKLTMQWNDAWLSNQDRDLDGVLDRHWGYDSYIGSGAWLTNKEFQYSCKIVAVPDDAYSESGVWYSSEGVEMGPSIWGAFAIVQEISKDYKYVSPYGPGFGKY